MILKYCVAKAAERRTSDLDIDGSRPPQYIIYAIDL